MARIKTRVRQSRTRLLSSVVILVLLGLCLVALSLHLWKIQESANLSQIGVTTESAARSYARETEIRYRKMLQALERLASKGVPQDAADENSWEEDAAFYIDAFEGFESIAWVDTAFRIQQIVPIQGTEANLGRIVTSIESATSEFSQWLPIVHEGEFEGFVFTVFNIVSFISPVLRELSGDYILQLSDEGALIFESENWDQPQESSLVFETITLNDTTVLRMAFAPTRDLLHSGIVDARRTLLFALLLSSIVLIAVHFARNYSTMARLNKLHYRSLFEASQDAIFIIDLKGGYQDANPATTRMVGYSLAELLNMTVDDLAVSEDRASPAARARLWAEGGTVEVALRGKEGQTIPVELVISPIEGKGTRKRILGIARDITERKQAEEATLNMEAHLRQSQKLESIGTLASGVAHEINNPLMGMINYADLIGEKVEDETIKEYSKVIMKEGNRIAEIVRNLLSFSRQDKETHSPANIKDIIDSPLLLVGSTMRKDQITIELNIPEELPQVKCRSQQIQQVIMNLLTNAHDALNERYPEYDENKLIRITVHPFEKDGDDWIRTTVEDHGVGIPKDVAQRIFDPFFTTKSRDEGTGLGLSVSFGIVREHNGQLTVESMLGEYTRFHMDLLVNNGWTHKKNGEEST
jgi:PAS domain S-box-containing protein